MASYSDGNTVIITITRMCNSKNRLEGKTDMNRKITLDSKQRDLAEAAYDAREGDRLRLYAVATSHGGSRVRWQVVGCSRDGQPVTPEGELAMLMDAEMADGKIVGQALSEDGELILLEEAALRVAGFWHGASYGDSLILTETNGEAHCTAVICNEMEETDGCAD